MVFRGIMAINSIHLIIMGIFIFWQQPFWGRELFIPRPDVVGLASIIVGVVSIFLLWQQKDCTRWTTYIQISYLLFLLTIGILRQLDGDNNTTWVMALNMLAVNSFFVIAGGLHDR